MKKVKYFSVFGIGPAYAAFSALLTGAVRLSDFFAKIPPLY